MKERVFILVLLLSIVSACVLQVGCDSETTITGGTSGYSTDTSQLISSWHLVSFGTAGSETAVITGTTITIQFKSDNTVSGSGGVNSYSSTYEAKTNGYLHFGAIAVTLMASSDQAIQTQETEYLLALTSVSSFLIRSGQLILCYGGGAKDLIFQ